MSQMSEQARAKAKERLKQIVAPNKGDIDASGWREPTDEKGNVATGMRPVSRRAYKAGGKVEGEATKMHAGRKVRLGNPKPSFASGGRTKTDGGLINTDVKKENEDRGGETHIGGLKRGGRTHKMVGGPMMGRPEMNKPGMTVAQQPQMGIRPRPAMGMMRAEGGKTEHGKSCSCAKCGGGAVAKKRGGSLSVTDGAVEGTRPEGGRLARKAGGRTKKGTNINIIIAPSGGQPKPPMMPPPGAPGPVGLHQGAPPPPPMMPPGGAAPMGPPAMGRKSGGRTYPIKDGSGGGEGRLQKVRAYG